MLVYRSPAVNLSGHLGNGVFWLDFVMPHKISVHRDASAHEHEPAAMAESSEAPAQPAQSDTFRASRPI